MTNPQLNPLTTGGPTSTPSRSQELPSTVLAWEAMECRTTPVGSFRAFLDGPTATLENLEIHATTINVGEASHAPHRHADEELVIVKEGMLEVVINGHSRHAGPGSLVFYASNDLHGMRNAGDAPATYHVIRWISTVATKTAANL